jgi:transcriptional regulator with XRE-family HTH domain
LPPSSPFHKKRYHEGSFSKTPVFSGRVISLNRREVVNFAGVCNIIGKYERDEVKPSIEVAMKIADALEVSLDYLVGKVSVELDAKTLKRLQDIQSFNEQDKAHIFELLDAFLRDRKTKKAYAS